MNNTQNEKIKQVTNDTMVIGIDIGSEKHWARAFDNRGMEISKKAFGFNNTAFGFSSFESWYENQRRAAGLKRIMVGLEPTGHYWFNIKQFLTTNGIQVVLVAPQHVKHSKELDDNTQRKDDLKDPRVIAKLVIEGRYFLPYRPSGVYADLRDGFSRRCGIVESMTRVKNRLHRWFCINFPEYLELYSSVVAKTGLMILRKAPLPKDIVELGVDGIDKIWREAKVRGIGKKKAAALVALAQESIGEKSANEAARLELWQLLEDYEHYAHQYVVVEEMLERRIHEVPYADNLLRIPGIGYCTVIGFFAEVGAVDRFDNPKQIQKLAGLSIVENSSGKRKGMPGISKRGRDRLRCVLYQAAMSAVKNNSEFKEIHLYFTTRKDNPLKKMQSLMAVAAKIIRVFYGMVRTGAAYDPERLLRDIHRPEKATA
jgi:transposase